MKSLRSRSLIPVFALIASLGLGIAPAQATPSLGTGLVRIDADWATVKMLPNGERVLTLDKQASGQWMGEIGRSLKPVVRDIDDNNLVKAWDDLGHESGDGVESTVTWNSVKNFQLERLADPVMTPRGHLRFVIEPSQDSSAGELPARLENVSVNITRASSLQSRTLPLTLPPYIVTNDALVQATIQGNYKTVQVVLMCDAKSVWSSTLNQTVPSQNIPSNLSCGSIVYESGMLKMTVPTTSQAGNVLLNASLSVSSGSPFNFSGVVATWVLNQ